MANPPQQGNTNLQDAAGNALGLAPSDNLALAGTVPATQMGQTGTGVASVERVANKIVNIAAVAVTAGTPVAAWTPATGKKFRVMAYHLSNSVASAIIMKDATTEFLRTPLMAAGAGQPSPNLGNGYLSATANNVLNIDVTASGTVHGFVIGIEE